MNASLKCRCGAVRGVIENVERSHGMRMICLCDDCQAYAHALGKAAEVLDENGGTDILPVLPAAMKITAGASQVRCLRLSPKGLMRWYAVCCKTPIANSVSSARMPYHGVVHDIVDYDGRPREEVLGPLRARIQGKFAKGKPPPGTQSTMSLGVLLNVLRFMAVGWVKGAYRPSPFFDAAGKPVVEPHVLARAEREALRPRCGPSASAAH